MPVDKTKWRYSKKRFLWRITRTWLVLVPAAAIAFRGENLNFRNPLFYLWITLIGIAIWGQYRILISEVFEGKIFAKKEIFLRFILTDGLMLVVALVMVIFANYRK